MPIRSAGDDRQLGRQALLDAEHGHHRGREAADGADREVDLAEQEDEDDADRDRRDRGDLQRQVGEVDGREEAVVRRSGRSSRSPRCPEARGPSRARRGRGGAGRPTGRSAPAARRPPAAASSGGTSVGAHSVVSSVVRSVLPNSAPVIAATTSSWLDSPTSKVAGDAPEPEHDDPVGDLEDVGEVVADHDHAEAAIAQPLDQLEDLLGLDDAERRRRLVEHHELRIAEQRAGDRDRLALPAGEALDLGADAADRRHAERREQLERLLLHRRLVEHVPGPPLTSSWPRNRLATTSRFSQSERSW